IRNGFGAPAGGAAEPSRAPGSIAAFGEVKTEELGVRKERGGGPASVRVARRHERRRGAGEHGRAVERERLRTEERGARRVEHVHRHVVRVWPHAEVRVVEEVRPE